MYKIIAIMGKAGSGKDSIMQGVLKQNPHLHEIISCTTRPPREGEIDGVNYHFLTGEEFGDKVLHQEMLEATCFNDWFYGTSYDSLRSDCINIGVFNPTGIESLLSFPDIDLKVYYILASDKQRLIRQLNREPNPDVQEIVRRFKADTIDFENIDFPCTELWNDIPIQYSLNIDRISKELASF